MALREDFQRSGNWLFRWRSFLPLVILPALLILIFLGMAMFIRVIWFVVFAISAFRLHYKRIMFAKEEFLRTEFGDLYLKCAEETPAFIPRFRQWRQPALSFSLKTVLKREYTAFFVMIASFTLLGVVADLLTEGKFEIDFAWRISFVLSLAAYAVIGTLKTKTRILHVEG